MPQIAIFGSSFCAAVPQNWKDSRCSFWALGTIMLKNRSAYMQSKAHGTGIALDTCQGKKWQICQEQPFYLGLIRDRSVLVCLCQMDEGCWQAYQSKAGEEDMKRLGKHGGMSMNLHNTHSTTLYCRKGLETQLNQVSHRELRVLKC